MDLFRSLDCGELVWSNGMSWSEDFGAYIRDEDDREYWLDDDMSDIETFEMLDTSDWNTYKIWCKFEGLKENDYKSLQRFSYLSNAGLVQQPNGRYRLQTLEEWLHERK